MIDLESMAVAMPEVTGHPNRAAFRGVLTTVDVPSQRSPAGAKGHLVVLTREAAEEALPSLLGMALDYSPTLDRHDVRRKVGVITRAEIVGRNLEIGGYLFARDFPEIVEQVGKSRREEGKSLACSSSSPAPLHAGNFGHSPGLRASLQMAAHQIFGLTEALKRIPASRKHRSERLNSAVHAARESAPQSGLGLSYEVTDVQLADIRAQVWTLEKVTFTGAAILRRDKAAYRDTWIELSR